MVIMNDEISILMGFAHSLRGFSRGFGDPSVSDMVGVEMDFW